MDKYVEVLCKQIPKTTLACGNPECKAKFTAKTRDLCIRKKYSHICEKCGASTEYDTSKLFDDVVKQLKAFGVTVK